VGTPTELPTPRKFFRTVQKKNTAPNKFYFFFEVAGPMNNVFLNQMYLKKCKDKIFKRGKKRRTIVK
jgi:hypothetical protein